MRKGFTQKIYVMLNLFQHRKSELPCDPGLSSSRAERDVEIRMPLGEMNSGRLKGGFTLAEVLITLGIVGIVGVMTIPNLIENLNTRILSESARSAKYKLTAATDQMKSADKIGPYYANTAAFVDELKKYMKVVKTCDSANITECWTTPQIKLADNSSYDVFKITTGAKFGKANDANNDYTSNNVGVVTADGTPMILSFNTKCSPLKPLKTYGWTMDNNKPVTNATTGCISAIIDVNGKKARTNRMWI